MWSRLIPARAGKTPRPRRPSCSAWAHPRAGGENYRAIGPASGPAGSSPRGRGKRVHCSVLSCLVGLIPARAGKTHHHSETSVRMRAHPRAGGENRNAHTHRKDSQGSSPRGRGKRSSSPTHETAAGLIPARAGKTVPQARSWSPSSAHPRAGGENNKGGDGSGTSPGSSPRGRGKLGGGGLPLLSSRLIPARAGKTTQVVRITFVSTAHPRAGGENGVGVSHVVP